MKRLDLLIIFICFHFLTLQAQIPEAPKNLLSPNAASLGQYGEIPVSLFTGTPNINIPIYDLSYGNISVPISLSYHASGIRPDQHPGWVGLGWTLNAGGMISRNIKDGPDEYNNENRYDVDVNHKMVKLSQAGYYFKHPLSDDDWSNQDALLARIKNNNYDVLDTEPDEFSFNFLNYSGSFHLDKNGKWKVECDKHVKVYFNNEYIDPNYIINLSAGGNTKAFKSFTIVDENGVKYVFGGDNSAIEYSMHFFIQNITEWFATSWMLKQIIQPNGMIVTFEYDNADLVNQMYISAATTVTTYDYESTYDDITHVDGIKQVSLPNTNGDPIFIDGKPMVYVNGNLVEKNIYNGLDVIDGMLISPVYLKKISSPICSINFVHSTTEELRYSNTIYEVKADIHNKSNSNDNFLPLVERWNVRNHKYDSNTTTEQGYEYYLKNLQWQQLDRIEVTDFSGDVVNKFKLDYSKSATQRLTLNSFSEINRNNEEDQKVYSFDYYDIDKMPPYLSLQTDHWGYFNNKFCEIKNTTNINYASDKDPNKDVVKYGSLKSIVYPTGGSTEFIYEPHDYKFRVKMNRWEGAEQIQSNKIAGGVRISKIINYPDGITNSNTKTEKSYFYLHDYKLGMTTGSSSGVISSQIEYSFNVKTTHYVEEFNYLDFFIGWIIPIKPEYIKLDINRLSCSYQSVLPASDNIKGSFIGYTEVTEVNSDGSYTNNVFSNFNTNMILNGKYPNYNDEKYDINISDMYSSYLPFTSKALERGKLLLSESYNNPGNKVQTRELTYTKINSDDVIRSLNLNIYKIDINVGGFLQAATNRIYTYSMLLNSETTTTYLSPGNYITKKIYLYDEDLKLKTKEIFEIDQNENYVTEFIYPHQLFKDPHFSLIFYENIPAFLSDPLKNKCLDMFKNGFINYPIEIIKSKNSKIIDSQLFNYQKFDNNYLLTDVSRLNTNTPLSDFSRLSTQNTTIDNRYESLPSQQFIYNDKANIIQMMKNTDNTVYLWGYKGLYPVAKIEGTSFQKVKDILTPAFLKDLSDSYMPTSEQINTIRTKLANNTILITTYTYKPLVGLLTMTDSRNTTTFYSCDNFNRLDETYIIENGKKKILQKNYYHYGKSSM